MSKRRMNHNEIKSGDFVMWKNMKYKVIALLKQGCLLLDNGAKPEAKECERLSQ